MNIGNMEIIFTVYATMCVTTFQENFSQEVLQPLHTELMSIWIYSKMIGSNRQA